MKSQIIFIDPNGDEWEGKIEETDYMVYANQVSNAINNSFLHNEPYWLDTDTGAVFFGPEIVKSSIIRVIKVK
jgi:hypothetical protein